MQTYEITIYNEQVRKLVLQGESHKRYSDDWGDSHYIEFKADSKEAATRSCERKYPQGEGFVIEGVTEV